MHQWRKLADPRWLSAHENILQARSHGRLVIISRPGRKRLQLERPCAEDSARYSIGRENILPRHSSFCRFRDRRTRNDGDVASSPRMLDSQMGKGLVACRSWDRDGDSRSRGETLWRGTRDWY